MGFLTALLARVTGEAPGGPIPDSAGLIEHLDVHVVARCPCGSTVAHQLTLVSTAGCRRCGRTIGLRSLTYRSGPGALPDAVVTVGYVQTDAALAERTTVGVH